MLKKIIPALVSVVLVGTSAAVLGFDMPKLPSASSNTPSSGGNAIAMQDGIVGKYVEASRQINAAQSELLQAFGLKDKAAALDAQAKALGSGATLDKDGIEKQKKLSDDANAAIQEKMDSGAQMSAEGKEHYAKSLLPFSAGVAITTKMPNDLSAFSNAAQSQIQSASVLDKAKLTSKLGPGLYLAKELPGYSSNLLSCFSKIVTYAKKNQIAVPKDATAVLGN